MGGILSLGGLACCCSSAACSLCCAACPSCKNSTSSRIMYAIILVITAVVSCILISPGLQEALKKVPFCQSNGMENNVIDVAIDVHSLQLDCSYAIGYLAVYRVCFIVSLFFMLLFLMMINVKSSSDFRSSIQNGFWGIKYLLIIGGTIGAFFIPNGIFGEIWMYVGMVGGLLFILIQQVILIDFAHSLAEGLNRRYSDTDNRSWMVLFFISMCLMYTGMIAGIVLLFVYYTGENYGQCQLHEFCISFNLILCCIISIISILPKIQNQMPNSSLLQPSCISLYVTYLTWSALSTTPDQECKPITDNYIGASSPLSPHIFTTENMIGLAIWFFVIIYVSLRTASNNQTAKISGTYIEEGDNGSAAEDTDGDHRVWDNEKENVAYSWSLLHFMFAQATLYLMMNLTNWFQPHAEATDFNGNWASFWVKIVSSWLCIALYTWTLVAPIIFYDREFGYN